MTKEKTNTTKKDMSESKFVLDQHLIGLLQKNAFYAEISRRIHKIRTTNIPTAGVTWNKELDNVCLYYNPFFLEKLTHKQVIGVLTHEFMHLIFGHLTNRRKTPHKMWNVCTDLAINSLIFANEKVSPTETNNTLLPLPDCCLIPGRPHYVVKKSENEFELSNGNGLTPEQKTAQPFAKFIEELPQLLASEEYFNRLNQLKEELKGKCPMCGGSGKVKKQKGQSSQGDSSGEKGEKEQNEGESSSSENCDSCGNEKSDCNCGHNHSEDGEEQCPCCGGSGDGMDSFDDHSGWDELSEEEREYVAGRVKNIVEKAIRVADSSNGWGNIPADVQAEIRRSISYIVPWRSVLKQFFGTLLPGERTSSIKKINRRYPYIHPGVKRNRRAKVLIAIDQSGSVDDQMLATFFAELTNLARNVDITILPFDCEAREHEMYIWHRGQPCPKGRVCCGGTNFDAPTELANSPKFRGRFDGMLILTDGQAPEPKGSRIKRGWILANGCKLVFDSNELQVFIDYNKPMKGAWR